MRILRNYILKEFFVAFFFSLMLLTLIMFMGNLINLSDMIIRKGLGVGNAFKAFGFFICYLLRYTIPLSFLLGTLLSMGRLITENEITAMRVAGISILRIFSIFFIIGVIFCLFLFILNDRITPSVYYSYRSRIKNPPLKNVSLFIEPGVFIEDFKDTILYVGDVEENKLKNVVIYQPTKSGANRVIVARRGEFVVDGGVLKMRLEEGFRDETNPKTKDLYRLNFKSFIYNIPIKTRERKKMDKSPVDMTLDEIKQKVKYLRKRGIDPVEILIEFHERIGISFSPLVFLLLGFGVSLSVKHREKSINFGIALLGGMLYYLIRVLGEVLSTYRYVPPFLGMWLPNIIIGAIGIYFIYRNAYPR